MCISKTKCQILRYHSRPKTNREQILLKVMPGIFINSNLHKSKSIIKQTMQTNKPELFKHLYQEIGQTIQQLITRQQHRNKWNLPYK